MSEWRIACCLPLLLFSLTSCSTLNSAAGGNTEQDALAAVSWGFQRDGLRINVDADAALNRYDDEAHTLVIAIMQTAEPTPFYQLLGNEALLHKLLLNGGTPPGALHFARFAIAPGHRQLIQLDRIAATQYVGIIVAYYGVSPSKTAQLFKIPVTIDRNGWVAKTYAAHVADAELRLKLGPDAIVSAEIGAYAPSAASTSGSSKTVVTPVAAIRLDELPAAE